MAGKTETAKAVNAEAEKRVEVKLPRNAGQNANQDEFYSVNFKNYIIKRGEYVEVPKELAEVIRNQQKDEEYAMRYADEKAQKSPEMK